MFERLDKIEEKYNEISKELVDPSIVSDVKKMTSLSKEQASLKDAYDLYQTYKKVINDIEGSKELAKDPELGDMAKEELASLESKKVELEHELEVILLPKDPNDEKNIIMEIRGAAGGDEANIFAGDLYRMYTRYAEKQGWKCEVIDSEPGSAGGFSQIELKIKGKDVYSKLKYESGAHRVQRIPVTDANGRIQTSTATVLVMPEADEVDVQINPEDIRVDIYRSGGHGGQGVNTTDSAVRITHIPTGIVCTCQNERSQIQNRATCMEMLRTKLYEYELEKHDAELGAERKSKIGRGNRSEKIRTYNYPQNRVTDHRIGFTTKDLDFVMEGKLDNIINALINYDQAEKMKGE